jgi:hypothetical protein
MTPLNSTFAFQDVTASLSGPGGILTLSGAETAAAEEAITITWGEEMNSQTIGADGSVMNSMHSSRAGTATFRLMKTSPLNAQITALIKYQHQSSALWGRNTITISDVARGDLYTLLAAPGCGSRPIPMRRSGTSSNMRYTSRKLIQF